MLLERSIDKRNADVITSQMILSQQEANILALIADVAFGTIGPVNVSDAPKTQVRYLSPQQVKFVDVMRKYPEMDKIVVHQGSVQYVEVSGKQEWSFTKKIKVAD